MSQGTWQGSTYTIKIEKLHKDRLASVRDDTLARIKKKRGTLKILVAGKGMGAEIPHDKIDTKIIFKGLPEPSRYGQPYRLCYFEVSPVSGGQERLI